MSANIIKLLLIEDDEDDYILTRDILAEIAGQQYDLAWVPKADDGFAALLTGMFDVCLVDYRIGERTGLELILNATARQCGTPLILLTGAGDRETDLAAAEAGATDYLEKPSLTPALLERSIRYSLSQARSRRTLLEQSLLLKLTLDNTGAGIATIDPNMQLVAWNDRFLEMIGMQPGDLSATAVFLQSPLGMAVASVLSSGDHGEVLSFEHVAADERTYEIRINPLPAGGRVTVCIDITKRKNTEVQLRVAKEQAEAAARTKSAFLATISHELKTPLNAIIGFSELMIAEVAGPLAKTYIEYSKDVNASGTHLLNLINDVLEISRIEAGRFELQSAPIEIGGLVENCVRMVRELASSASLTVTVDIPPEPPVLLGDERLIRRVLANLLSNAIKFTNPGGLVRVGLTTPEEAGGLSLFVQDTGIGIAPCDIPGAFMPFGQIDAALSRKYDGTGLGLALVKAVAELHDGAVDLESEVGKGTRVAVTFPMPRVQSPSKAFEMSVV